MSEAQDSEDESREGPPEDTPLPVHQLAQADTEARVRYLIGKWLEDRAHDYREHAESAREWAAAAEEFEEYTDARKTVRWFENAQDTASSLARDVQPNDASRIGGATAGP